jgi:hypothetical protein
MAIGGSSRGAGPVATAGAASGTSALATITNRLESAPATAPFYTHLPVAETAKGSRRPDIHKVCVYAVVQRDAASYP